MKNLHANGRLTFLDFAKCIAMFLVVFAHCFVNDSSVRLYIYAFHMPFFFFVSGMLHKQGRPYWGKLMKPTLFFVLLFLIISIPLYQCGIWDFKSQYLVDCPKTWVETLFLSIKLTIINIIGGGKFANHYCWFLLVLCGCKWMMERYLSVKKKIALVWLVLSFAVLWATATLLHVKILWIAHTVMAFPFYFAGYYSKNLTRSFVNWRYHYWIFPVALVLTCLLTHLNGRVSMMGATYGEAPSVLKAFFFYLNGMIGSMLLFSICPRRGNMPFCTKISKGMISILGFQGLFIPFLIGKVSIWEAALIAPCIILVCYGLHHITSRLLPFVYQSSYHIKQ